MRKILIGGIVLGGLVLVSILFYFNGTSSQSGLNIESTPQAEVYINNVKAGVTPYKSRTLSGDVVLKLVPQDGKPSWTTKLTLAPGIETVVRRDFGENESQSSGEILSYERSADQAASLVLVSNPDRAQIVIDGEIKGITPLPVKGISSGDHKIIVSQNGFQDREIAAKTQNGYKLVVIATLAQGESTVLSATTEESSVSVASPSAQPQATPLAAPLGQIEILDTPLGYLKVRSEASSQSTEVGQATIGAKYSIIEVSSGWYKIEYLPGQRGWVSSQYAQKVQ